MTVNGDKTKINNNSSEVYHSRLAKMMPLKRPRLRIYIKTILEGEHHLRTKNFANISSEAKKSTKS